MDGLHEWYERRPRWLGLAALGWWLNLSLMSCLPIQPVPFEPFADGADAALAEPMMYYLKNTGIPIIVPAGFVTDFASTPRAIWALLPPFGTYQKAAVIHDYLYWMQECTKEQADKILYIAMEESDVSSIDITVIYNGVNWGGTPAWNQNAEEKKKGLTRFVPVDSQGHLKIGANDIWNDTYRRNLGLTKYDRKSSSVPPPLYCKKADEIFQDP